MSTSRYHWPLLVALLLFGAFIRWNALSEMKDTLLYDEAFYAADALSVWKAGRIVPFFPTNLGYESLGDYWSLPSLLVFGSTPFAVRLVPTTTGILTLAALYVLAAEILGRRGALWSVGALAALYFHVHSSYLGFQSILIPLIGSLAFARLLRAYRTNRHRDWLASGVLVGLLAYSYIQARAWVVLALVMQTAWALAHQPKRRGVALSVAVSSVIMLPLLVYFLQHPAVVVYRPVNVAASGADGILDNLRRWAEAWFYRGSEQLIINKPDRPLLDLPLGILFLVGLFTLSRAVRRRWMAAWLIVLALVTLIPAVLGRGSPNTLRAIGLAIPIAIACGAGALWIERWFAGRLNGRPQVAFALPLALVIAAGWHSIEDFRSVVPQFAPYVATERQTMRAIDYIAANLPEDAPVYFAPLPYCYPVPPFRAASLEPRPYSAFDSRAFTLVRDQPAYYVALSVGDSPLEETLAQWADVSPVYNDPAGFTIWEATAYRGLVSGWDRALALGDSLLARHLTVLAATARPGDTLEIVLALRPRQPAPRIYTITVALRDLPNVAASLPLISPGERYVCAYAAPPMWMPEEIVAESFTLTLPAGIAPGRHAVVASVTPSGEGGSAEVMLGEVEVAR